MAFFAALIPICLPCACGAAVLGGWCITRTVTIYKYTAAHLCSMLAGALFLASAFVPWEVCVSTRAVAGAEVSAPGQAALVSGGLMCLIALVLLRYLDPAAPSPSLPSPGRLSRLPACLSAAAGAGVGILGYVLVSRGAIDFFYNCPPSVSANGRYSSYAYHEVGSFIALIGFITAVIALLPFSVVLCVGRDACERACTMTRTEEILWSCWCCFRPEVCGCREAPALPDEVVCRGRP